VWGGWGTARQVRRVVRGRGVQHAMACVWMCPGPGAASNGCGGVGRCGTAGDAGRVLLQQWWSLTSL
jgi:hypothetical protein